MTTRDISFIALFTALLAISSILVIPLWPVPITLQVFFFLLIPALLGPVKSALSIILYMVLGLIGLPVFAGGNGGFQSIFSPSFGFILGAIFVALYVGKRTQPIFGFKKTLLHMIIGIFILYLSGMTHQYFIMTRVMEVNITFPAVIGSNLLTFFPLDLAKALLATIVYLRLRSLKYFKTI